MEELIVQGYDWITEDRDNFISIRIWCHDRESNRVLIRVEDYYPICRIELPTFVDGKLVEWNHDARRAYANWIRHVMSEDGPINITTQDHKKLYTYREEIKTPFIICMFRSEENMRYCVNLINKKPYQIPELGLIRARALEVSIATCHRMVTELVIGYSQWLRVKATPVNKLDAISLNFKEYLVSYKDIQGIPESESKGWIADPTVGAIDIETYATNPKAMPNKLFIGDVTFMISYIFQRLFGKERTKYLLVLGDYPASTDPNVHVRIFPNEIAMIDGLSDLIRETDPTILTGYNIFNYDYPYLDARVKQYLRDWKPCGLIKNKKTFVNTKRWKSSAYGYMSISNLEVEGRINIDMFPIVKRDYKLDRYTLDFVSNFFLERGKHDVSAAQMFRSYKAYLDCVAELKNLGIYSEPVWYMVQRPMLPEVPNSVKTWFNNIPEKYQALVQRFFNKPIQDIHLPVLNRYVDILQKLELIGEYNLEDSVLCIDLMLKLNTWISLTELSSIVAVPLVSTFTRGQQIRVQNQVYQYAYREGFVIDERAGSKEKFMGAHVVDPIPGKYRYILILDFNSLYPSIIRYYNICYTTLVPDESPIPDEMCHIIEWDEPQKDKTVIHRRYRWIKQEHYSGILPRMCEHLVTTRKKVRKQIGPHNDKITNTVLDNRQNALKISANSIFGALGVSEGRMPLPEGAACITAKGRELSRIAGRYVEEKYGGKIVYGDTDSIMVDLGITDPHECKIMGEKLGKEISDLFGDPLRIEYEKGLAIALFIKKKKYAGVLLETIEKNDDPSKGPLVEVTEVKPEQFAPEYQIPNNNLWKIRYKTTAYGKVSSNETYIAVPDHIPLTMDQKYYSGTPLTEEITQKEEDGFVIVDIKRGSPNKKKLLTKGIVLARRDNCLWLKSVYERILLKILFDKSLYECCNLIDDEIKLMMSRSIPFLKMSITKGVGTNYKPTSTHPMKIFVDELRQIGYPVQGGDRIDYVFVRRSNPEKNTKQGFKMRLHEHFWQQYAQEPLDCLHYVEKILMKPIEQILYLGYKNEIDQIELKFTPSTRRRKVIYTYMSKKYIGTWVKLLKAKEDLCMYIKMNRPHYPSQRPYFLFQNDLI